MFNDRISGAFNTFDSNRKICYFLGNFKIWLLETPRAWSYLRVSWYFVLKWCFPVLTNPIKITRGSATLIDYILTNNIKIDSNHIQCVSCCSICHRMMTSSNASIFRIASPLWGESTGHRWIPLKKASGAELWCFLWSALEQTPKQTVDRPVICNAIALIMTSL